MATIGTTRMSSKGQVVIPEEIRRQLGLQPGTQFIVVADRDAVVLRTIAPPSAQRFDEALTVARTVAREVGLTPADVEAAVVAVRNRRRTTQAKR